MTGTDEARKYKDMVSGKQIIESRYVHFTFMDLFGPRNESEF